MKKTIRVIELRKTQREVEVDFPIYSRQDVDSTGSVIYMRADADGRKFSIQRITRGESVEYTLSSDPSGFEKGADLDFMTGAGSYASSKAEFDLALTRAQSFLKQISEL